MMSNKSSLATDSTGRKHKTRVFTSDHWTPHNDWAVAGIGFDRKGLHVAVAYIDADTDVYHETISWDKLDTINWSREDGGLFKLVSEIYIDDEAPTLTLVQRKRMDTIIDAIYELPKRCYLRVARLTKTPKAYQQMRLVSGKNRSLVAASVAFRDKLRWRKKLHCYNLQAMLVGRTNEIIRG